jgi:transitional endoplasmic reticulum ATPase
MPPSKPKNDVEDVVDSREEAKNEGLLTINMSQTFAEATIEENVPVVGRSYKEVMKNLSRMARERETLVQLNEQLVGYPLDGMLALWATINKVHGWVDLREIITPGFFGPNVDPPQLVTVATGTGKNDNVQVPWGRMLIPGIKDAELTPCASHRTDRGEVCLTLHGQCRKKDKLKVVELIKEAREYLKNNSIYKGKALRVKFEDDQHIEEGDLPNSPPQFIDTSTVKLEELVFSENVQHAINDSLYEPVENTQGLRDAGIPRKRGILLAGTYGVGKTMLLGGMGKKCEENGWTYITIDSVKHLAEAIRFSRLFEPAMIVAEDIDRVVKGEERTIGMDSILNIIDGVDSKGRELVIVLTTNAPDKINSAMLRSGRIDALIEITPPDANACIELVKRYGGAQLDNTADYTDVGGLLAGNKAADVRECVERAKLSALRRQRLHKGSGKVGPQDLKISFDTMLKHIQLAQPKPQLAEPSIDRAFRETVEVAVDQILDERRRSGNSSVRQTKHVGNTNTGVPRN